MSGVSRNVAGLLLVCASLGIGSGALANHTDTQIGDWNITSWHKVPDFDQWRIGLPGNGGMYCVPTSSMNWFAYFAHHGYPSIFPGDKSIWEWMQSINHDPLTTDIDGLGVIMNTSATTGTKSSGMLAGMGLVLNDFPFIVFHYWTHSTYTPSHHDVRQFTKAKVPTSLGIAWVDESAYPFLVRVGGHKVTTVATHRNGHTGSRKLEFNDPADESALLFLQSPFSAREHSLTNEYVWYKGYNRWLEKIEDYGTGRLDNITAIVPVQGLTESDDSLKIWIHTPNKFNWDLASALTQVIDLSGDGLEVVDIEQVPGSMDVMYIGKDPAGVLSNAIYRVDPVAGTTEHVIEVPNAVEIELGRYRQLYVNDGTQIRCIDFDVEIPDEVANVVPPEPIAALAYNDLTDELVVLTTNPIEPMFIYHSTLAGTPSRVTFTIDPDFGGPASMAVSPVDGSVFLTSESMDSVQHVMNIGGVRATTEDIANGALSTPGGINVGDRGELYATSNGVIVEYDYDDGLGQWVASNTSSLSGMATGKRLHVPHSRTNFDPDTMLGTEYDNLLPTEFSEVSSGPCYADLNEDLTVDGADLGLLLANWGMPGGPEGDMDFDGDVDGADLGLFLAAWGPCP